MAADAEPDGVEELVESPSAEKLDILARRTCVACEGVGVVVGGVGLEEDMVARQTKDLVARTALSEVQAHSALSVRPVSRSDGEAESGRERTANVDGVVDARDVTK